MQWKEVKSAQTKINRSIQNFLFLKIKILWKLQNSSNSQNFINKAVIQFPSSHDVKQQQKRNNRFKLYDRNFVCKILLTKAINRWLASHKLPKFLKLSFQVHRRTLRFIASSIWVKLVWLKIFTSKFNFESSRSSAAVCRQS